MYACPWCEYQVPDAATECPSCNEDVTALARLQELPDLLFNRTLAALRQGDTLTAVTQCAMALQLRVRDPGCWTLLGLIAARQGALSLAESCWRNVLLMKRDDTQAQEGLKLIQQIRQSR